MIGQDGPVLRGTEPPVPSASMNISLLFQRLAPPPPNGETKEQRLRSPGASGSLPRELKLRDVLRAQRSLGNKSWA